MIYSPTSWEEFVGHRREKALLLETKRAAERRGEHWSALLWGPPGCGKSTLARIALPEADVKMASDVSSLYGYTQGFWDSLILEELHALPRGLRPDLLELLDSGNCTLIGTTTHPEAISDPARGRFRLELYISPYNEGEIVRILANACHSLHITGTREGLSTIAASSRGNPRMALRILARARDISHRIDARAAEEALRSLGFRDGLLPEERAYLDALRGLGGRASLQAIAGSLGLSPQAVEQMEGYLLQRGLVTITSMGRMLR